MNAPLNPSASSASHAATADSNALLAMNDLPVFDRFDPALVGPALEVLLAEARTALEAVVAEDSPADFDVLDRTLSTRTERLSRVWGMVSHLNSVADTPPLREAYKTHLPVLTEFWTALGSDERLFHKYRAVKAAQGEQLSPQRQTLLAHWLRGFVLGGAELQGEARLRYAAIQERLAELSQQFSEHVLDATDRYTLEVPASRLDGVPPDVLDATRIEGSDASGEARHRLTLHMPVYLPLMQYANDRDLRATLYRAYCTRASEAGESALDNSAIMVELIQLRQEEAALLGYPGYADVSLVPKMAESPDQVDAFLVDMAAKARPWAERDLQELRDFAREHLGLATVEAWDTAWASERLKEHRYAFSDQEVKAYFTEPTVLQGLFGIIESLFDVRITPAQAPVWHEGVQFFCLERAGQAIAHFYLDPYARPGKRPGAWMDDARGRWKRPDTGAVQTPVAYLVCNYAPPQGGRPALLTHDDVITLFHEFGHGLHHMLTQVDELGIAGISGVEWDAVELPSQFMENFCWEWSVLQRLTCHIDTGEPLPRALFDKMIAAKNFQSGLQTLRQIEFSLFDLRIHRAGFAPQSVDDIHTELERVRDQVSVVRPPAFNRFAHTFSHIFAGGYSAGYYSYKWAEVLSADAWSAFEEAGIMDATTGQRYLKEILERGASRSALDNFRAFRGRDPQPDALLRHQGMAA
ncbi:M3 family metallopeptidase [Amphibiibacter pelophylacis]|uniref:M3 family metallopeptidase n=1 Tax=Amphibiibacter pelophylacis TaxID=1799477 RepID=A0ACC6NZR1_9BURK